MRRLRLLHSDGKSYLYMVAPTDLVSAAPTDPIIGGQTIQTPGSGPLVNILPPPSTTIGAPTPAPSPAPPISTADPTPAPDPNDPLQQDFYTMDCVTLKGVISNVENILQTARLTGDQYNYYSGKLAQAQSAFAAKCGGTITPPPAPPPITQPTTPPTTVNIGDTSTLNPSLSSGDTGAGLSGGAGGGGGGSDSSKPAAKKKTNWLLWALALGTLALCLYKGRNTTIKMPG